jgi:hypothetical protein
MSSIFGGAFFIFNGARTFGLTGVGMMLIGSKGPPAVTDSAGFCSGAASTFFGSGFFSEEFSSIFYRL